MKSFGLWYKEYREEEKKENANVLPNQDDSKGQNIDQDKNNISLNNEKPQFDFHANYWSLGDITTNAKIKDPYLDIGIRIDSYKLVDKLTFYCPFKVTEDSLMDLSDKLKFKDNASLVFNDVCEIETQDIYTIIKLSTEDKLLLFPLKEPIEGICTLEDVEEGTCINFDFKEFKKYVEKSNSTDSSINNVYIRFRLCFPGLKDMICFDDEPLNKSFESAFSGTRTIDFKINEQRNISPKIRAKITLQEEKMACFTKIHFLIMEPSSYDLVSFSDDQVSCRELEGGEWNNYLDTEINQKKGHVLAYHWKKKSIDGKPKQSFSCLVKIRYSKTSRKTIAAYSLIVISLNIASSFLFSQINAIEDSIPFDIFKKFNIVQILSIILIFSLGVWLVKDKK